MAEERRLVTVLFADVTGSTALGEELDPEDVRALLRRYYDIAKDVVGEHGGTLEKFIGDAVMAVFGIPQAHGDDAERALAAALALRDRVRDAPELGERLPIRLGLNTGEVVATPDRTAGDFLLTGDAVNTAARIQQAGDPWTIHAGERTARAARGAFEFGPARALDAKGKRMPVRVREVLGRAERGRAPRVPLVGRSADLAQLELVARRAFSERRPFLVSLIAPAGTGKTRLLEEFLDQLPQVAGETRVAIAQCLPYGQRLTYWPLRAVLYRLIGASEDAPPVEVRERAQAWVREGGAERPDVLANQLAGTVGAGEGELSDRAALFAAWRAAIELAARREPLVIVFEDLHWSSDSLLDLVEFVMQPRGDAPILMLVLTRPELLDRRPAWGGGRRNHLALSLEPLAPDAVAELVRHLIESASPEIVERVVARSEGNPFYAGELVRSLIERTSDLTDVGAVERALASLPDTVQATVLARLDLLDRSQRRVLQVGAVFGRAFRPAGVAAVEQGTGDVEAICEALIERDLIRPSGADGFAFRHILIREVAYQTLPRTERARLHARAGEWLAAGAADREDALAELIAFHFREAAQLAGSLDDATASAVRGEAVRWLARAAETALAAAASVEAARHLESAIELAPPADRPPLYERLGNCALGGRHTVDAYRAALDGYRAIGAPPDRELAALAGLLNLYTRSQGAVGDRPSVEALNALRAEGEFLAARATDERVLARFFIGEGFVPFWLSATQDLTAEEIEAGRRNAQRGFDMAERLDDAVLMSAALDGLASNRFLQGDWRGSVAINRRRLGIQDRLDLIEKMDAHSVLTWAFSVVGDLDEAAAVSAAGLALVQPGQVPSWALHLVAWRAYALMLRGDWDETQALGDRALRLWAETGHQSAGYSVRGFISALHVARARGDERRVERLRDAVDRIASAFPAGSPARGMAKIAAGDPAAVAAGLSAERGTRLAQAAERNELALAFCADAAQAVEPDAVRDLLASADRTEAAPLAAQAHRSLGVSLADRAELARALEIFERIGAIPYAARARCELALLDRDDAEFARGAAALQALGDATQLARYDARR